VGDVTPRSSPVAVLGGLTFREVCSFDNSLSFGLTFDGSLFAWGGLNSNGELGVGDVSSRSIPVAVLGGLKFRKVVVSQKSVYGLTTGGDLYAWGGNANGQLGLGDVASRSSPVAVLGGLKFQDMASTANTFFDAVLAVAEDGTAYAWGDNTDGRLGVGDIIPRSSPVAVLGGLKFQKLMAIGDTSGGVSTDGSFYGWGVNTNGQLGVGDIASRSSPVIALGGLSFQEVSLFFDSLSGFSATGLSTEGKLFSWGVNDRGQLGVGDTTFRSSPVLVLSGLSLKTQDDSDAVLDIPVVGGTTYSLRLGAGPCFFGSKPIGKDVYKVEVTYIE
jgi:alpha-tubulin suppressor-like RCC1 family protein